jgi:hypothetical protein
MTRTAFRTTILAAAAFAAVTAASAQGMKAEIPFSFDAVGTRMQPGAYWITLNNSGSGAVVHIYNSDNRKSVLTLPRLTSTPARPEYSNPVLTFACTDGHCVLSSLRNEHASVYEFSGPKPGRGARIATIALRTDRAE